MISTGMSLSSSSRSATAAATISRNASSFALDVQTLRDQTFDVPDACFSSRAASQRDAHKPLSDRDSTTGPTFQTLRSLFASRPKLSAAVSLKAGRNMGEQSGGSRPFNGRANSPSSSSSGLAESRRPPVSIPAQWAYFAIFAGAIAGLILESAGAGSVSSPWWRQGIWGLVERDRPKALSWALHGFRTARSGWIFGAFVFSTGYKKSGPRPSHRAQSRTRWAVRRSSLLALRRLAHRPGAGRNAVQHGALRRHDLVVSNIPACLEPSPGAKISLRHVELVRHDSRDEFDVPHEPRSPQCGGDRHRQSARSAWR